MDQRRLALAMKLGDTYRMREITGHQFAQLARELALDPAHVLDRARELAQGSADLLTRVYERERADGLQHPLLERLVERLRAHLAHCRVVLVG